MNRLGWLAGFFFVLGIVLVLVVYGSQFGRGESTPRVSWVRPPGNRQVELQIAYPERLVREGPAVPQQVLSAWLESMAPFTSTQPLTASQYLLTFEPLASGVNFVDKEGKPVAPDVPLVPAPARPMPGLVYLRWEDVANNPSSVDLIGQLYDPAGQIVISDVNLSVELESNGQAFWRRLGERLFSSTTPLLSLAAALVTFALQQYKLIEERHFEAEKKRQEEAKAEQERQQKKEKENRLAQIESVKLLVPDQLEEAIREFVRLRRISKIEADWQTPEIVKQFADVWGQIRQEKKRRRESEIAEQQKKQQKEREKENQAADRARQEKLKEIESIRLLIPNQMKEAISKFSRLKEIVDTDVEWQSREIVTRLADVLEHMRQQKEYTILANHLGLLAEQGDSDEPAELRAYLRRLDWPHLWSGIPPAESKDVADWLENVSLKFNPFGPESAELAPRLPFYVIDDIYDDARGPRACVVTGAPGSGKTAAALMLAYDCTHPPANPLQAGAFPIYYPLQPSTAQAIDMGTTAMDLLARATARQLLRYFVLRPQGFLDLPPFRQDSVQLFLGLAFRDARPLLEAEIKRLPLSLRQAVLPAEWVEPPALRTDDWFDLFSEVLPVNFHRYEWLVDVHPPLAGVAQAPIQSLLGQLLELSAALIVRSAVYLKLFVPEQEVMNLGDLSEIQLVSLSWGLDDLSRLYDQRFRQAGCTEPQVLCGPSLTAETLKRDLLAAADGSPRRLIQIGNALLANAAQHLDQPLLRDSDLRRALHSPPALGSE